MKTEKITLGGGCFWCLEAVFKELEGVKSVVSGYAGGHTENPTYEDVCKCNTGHAEVVQIHFEPECITLKGVLDVFWKAHDPTTLDRQGNDIGTQYRSTIMPHNKEQRDTALESMNIRQKMLDSPITTVIEPLNVFYEAEKYHQDYYRLNPRAPYCSLTIEPKLNKLKEDKVLLR